MYYGKILAAYKNSAVKCLLMDEVLSVDNLAQIINAFIANFEAFAAEQDCIHHEVLSTYKDGPDKQELKEVIGRLYYHQFDLDFVYSLKTCILGPRSVLSVRIWLSKNEKTMSCTLYDLMSLLDKDNFKCYIYPYIPNADLMNECFKTIAGDVKSFIPGIADIAANKDLVEQVYDNVKADIAAVWNSKLFEPQDYIAPEVAEAILNYNIELYNDWLMLRYATGGYLTFLNGKYIKAIKSYSRYKKRLAYEERLLAFLKSLKEGECYDAVPNGLNTLREGLKAQNNAGELPVLLLAWLFATPVLLVLYLALYYLCLFIFSGKSLYNTGIELYNAMFVFLPAFLTAICLSYFMRKKVYALLFRKSAKRKLEYDAILNSSSEEKFMRGFTRVLVSLGLIFTVLLANTHISFKHNGIVDKSSPFSLRGTFYPYSEVNSLWRIEGRYNGFGEWLDAPSYVIVFKNEKKLDLYQYLEYSDMERHILPILTQKGFEVRKADSLDDVGRE